MEESFCCFDVGAWLYLEGVDEKRRCRHIDVVSS